MMTAVFVADLHPITAAALERAIDQHPALAFKGAYPRPADLLAAIEEHPGCACVVDPQIFREDLEPYAGLVRRAGTIVLWTASMSARVDPR
ncbi:MAG TPA: hypothetical protein VM557_06525 [Thermoanaerobaculia bacterium]|nr:hypothetical protein [Thermoanaerobaculia bacterium]